jgi:hypothetical protein
MPEFGALSKTSLESLARHDWGWADTKCSMCGMQRGCSSYLGEYYCLYCLPIAIKQATVSTGVGTPFPFPGFDGNNKVTR